MHWWAIHAIPDGGSRRRVAAQNATVASLAQLELDEAFLAHLRGEPQVAVTLTRGLPLVRVCRRIVVSCGARRDSNNG